MSFNSLRTTLTIYLPMQETSGTTVNDESGNSRDATASTDTSGMTATGGPTDYLTNCLDFNGTSHYVVSQSNTLLSATGFSVFGWRKQDTTTGAQEYIGSDQSAIGTRQVQFRGNGSSIEFIRFNPSAVTATKTSSTVAGTWNFVFARFSNSTGSTIAQDDGSSPGTQASTANNNSAAQALIFGARTSNGSSFDTYLDGKLAGMGAANYALSDAEFQELRNGPELNYVSGVSFADTGAFNVGTWAIPSVFSGSNGTVLYSVIAVNAAGSQVGSTATTASGTIDLSSNTGNICYLMVKVSNTGGADVGDKATRTTSYGSTGDGYYEIASVTAAGGGGGLSIPIAMYHYTHHLGTMSR